MVVLSPIQLVVLQGTKNTGESVFTSPSSVNLLSSSLEETFHELWDHVCIYHHHIPFAKYQV